MRKASSDTLRGRKASHLGLLAAPPVACAQAELETKGQRCSGETGSSARLDPQAGPSGRKSRRKASV